MSSNGIKDRVAIVGMSCTPFREHFNLGRDDLLIAAADDVLASVGVMVWPGVVNGRVPFCGWTRSCAVAEYSLVAPKEYATAPATANPTQTSTHHLRRRRTRRYVRRSTSEAGMFGDIKRPRLEAERGGTNAERKV